MYFSAALRVAHFATHIATPFLMSGRVYFQQFSWSAVIHNLFVRTSEFASGSLTAFLNERNKNCAEDFSSAVDRNYTKCKVKGDPWRLKRRPVLHFCLQMWTNILKKKVSCQFLSSCPTKYPASFTHWHFSTQTGTAPISLTSVYKRKQGENDLRYLLVVNPYFRQFFIALKASKYSLNTSPGKNNLFFC